MAIRFFAVGETEVFITVPSAVNIALCGHYATYYTHDGIGETFVTALRISRHLSQTNKETGTYPRAAASRVRFTSAQSLRGPWIKFMTALFA